MLESLNNLKMDNSKDRVGPEVVVRNTAPVIWDKAYISRVWSGSLTIHRKWASFSLLSEKSHAAAAKSLQSCPTLCDPIDGSPPGSSVPGILQARTLEWVALSFSNAWKWKVKVKSLSRAWLLATPWIAAYQAPPSMGFSRQEYWSGLPLPSPEISYTSIEKRKKELRWRPASDLL